MSADIKKLRNRIKSVNSTLQLTKAMGLVASSKIRRALEGMNKARQYVNAVNDAVSDLCGSQECKTGPYMAVRESGRTRLVVIAGDRGLAGGYNANVFRLSKEFSEAEIIPIGKRACERFGKDILLTEGVSFKECRKISEKICEDFKNGEFDKFGIIMTKYNSIMSQEAQIVWVLPLDNSKEDKNSGVIFEPDEVSVLNTVIPEYVAGVIYAAVKESFASEVAARRVAMDSAGKNAQQMIDELGLLYNRARQGSITQEITEIVAGSDV